MGPDELYQVTVGRLCAGLTVRDGRVAACAPILTWSTGLELERVIRWAQKRGGTVERLPRTGEMAEASQIRLDVGNEV
jgi:hypothetical protein